MLGWSYFNEFHEFGLSLMVGFYGLLSTGKPLTIQAWQVHKTGPLTPTIINLGLTKPDNAKEPKKEVFNEKRGERGFFLFFRFRVRVLVA